MAKMIEILSYLKDKHRPIVLNFPVVWRQGVSHLSAPLEKPSLSLNFRVMLWVTHWPCPFNVDKHCEPSISRIPDWLPPEHGPLFLYVI